MTPTTREQDVKILHDMRRTAQADLLQANGRGERQWVQDRIDDIQWATRELVRMGEL